MKLINLLPDVEVLERSALRKAQEVGKMTTSVADKKSYPMELIHEDWMVDKRNGFILHRCPDKYSRYSHMRYGCEVCKKEIPREAMFVYKLVMKL
jgi:hypothetical protein